MGQRDRSVEFSEAGLQGCPPIDERVRLAKEYEAQAKATPGAFPISLTKGAPFWSHGWQGCPRNCGRPLTDWTVRLKPKARREAGVLTVGFYCR